MGHIPRLPRTVLTVYIRYFTMEYIDLLTCTGGLRCIILLPLTPDDFTRQGESSHSERVNLLPW